MQYFLVVSFGSVIAAAFIYLSFELRILVGYCRLTRKKLKVISLEEGEFSGNRPAPKVIVQVPIFNEGAVALEVVTAVCALDYPRNRFEIQILDDSSDATPDLLAPLIEQNRALGIDIRHLRRVSRHGWKAGALAWGLTMSDAEFVAIFDADFLPPPDFLRRALIEGNTFADDDVAFLQGRWTHGNAIQNMMTRAQAILLDRHFTVQKPYQSANDRTVAFNGSGGIWRRSAIEKAGGWSADTLCEDLDLSYRCALAGLKGRYDSALACPSEIPSSILAFKLQQRRWAKGTAQCLRKLGAHIFSSKEMRYQWQDIHAIGGYACHPIVLAYCLLWPWVVLKGLPTSLLVVGQICMGITNATTCWGLVMAARASGRKVEVSLVRDVASALVLGSALIVTSSVAFLTGCFRGAGVFERTPKQGTIGNQQTSRSSQLKLHWTIYLEVAFLVYMLCSSLWLITEQQGLQAISYLVLVASTAFFIVAQMLERFLPQMRWPSDWAIAVETK